MLDSPRVLCNRAHMRALAEEGNSLRRKADSAREAAAGGPSGAGWNPLLLTLYVQVRSRACRAVLRPMAAVCASNLNPLSRDRRR
jgi:hypothetical protein